MRNSGVSSSKAVVVCSSSFHSLISYRGVEEILDGGSQVAVRFEESRLHVGEGAAEGRAKVGEGGGAGEESPARGP